MALLGHSDLTFVNLEKEKCVSEWIAVDICAPLHKRAMLLIHGKLLLSRLELQSAYLVSDHIVLDMLCLLKCQSNLYFDYYVPFRQVPGHCWLASVVTKLVVMSPVPVINSTLRSAAIIGLRRDVSSPS